MIERISSVFVESGLSPLSVTIFGSVATGVDDEDSDLDLLCLVADSSDDRLRAVDAELTARAGMPVSVIWMDLATAQEEAMAPGTPVAAALTHGLHVTGQELRDLIPDSVAFDGNEAARGALERARASAQGIRRHDANKVPTHALSVGLVDAASAALLHTGKGRFKTKGERLTKSVELLGSVVGTEQAQEFAALYASLPEDPLSRPSRETVDRVFAMIDVLLRASDGDHEG